MEFYVGYSTEIPPPTSLISGWNSVDLGFTFPPPHSALSPPEAVGKEGRTRFFLKKKRNPTGILEKPYKYQLTPVLKKFEVWNPRGGI